MGPMTGNKKLGMGNNGAPQNHLNMMQNIKREYKDSGAPRSCPDGTTERGNKRAGLQNIGVSHNHPKTPENTSREWHALYTKQITQKAKKYHDGILRLEFRGSTRRQVMLYDTSRKLLDTKFLKKDEEVESGETVVFDSHLVDIGDTKEMDSSLHGLKAGVARNSSFVGNKQNGLKNVGAHQTCPNVMRDAITEWNVLYTTQITQKAKKYHDGILRLAVCVAHRKQVILLNEDGNVLNNKYLNSSEDVRPGVTLELTNYLVEIGEARISQGGEILNDASSGIGLDSHARSSNINKIKFRSGNRNKPIRDETQNDASSGKGVGSYSKSLNVDKIKVSGSGSRNQPIRDAHQILSTLKRPIDPENLAPNIKPLMKQICSSQSSDLSRFELRKKLLDQNALEPEFSNGIAVDDHEDSPRNVGSNSLVRSQSKADRNVPNLSITHVIDLDQGGELQPTKSTLSNISCGLSASNIPTSKSDVDYPEKSMTNLPSSITEPQVSDIAVLELPEDARAPSTSMQNDGLNGSAEGSNGNANGIASNLTGEKSNQLCADTVGTNSGREEGFTLGFSSLSCSTSFFLNDVDKESPQLLRSMSKEQRDKDDFPSFDLGF